MEAPGPDADYRQRVAKAGSALLRALLAALEGASCRLHPPRLHAYPREENARILAWWDAGRVPA